MINYLDSFRPFILLILCAVGAACCFIWLGFASSSPYAPGPPYFVPAANNVYVLVVKDDLYYLSSGSNGAAGLVPIGKSSVDLRRFAGQRVIAHLDYPKSREDFGRYVSNMQCVNSRCKPLAKDGTVFTATVDVRDISLTPAK